MRPLSVAQREALRAVGDGRWETVPARTMNSLQRQGLIDADGMSLSAAGATALDGVLASGDGPEALKELLRFPVRR